MKSKLKITLLVLTCFTLLGCPPGQFHSYTYIGTQMLRDGLVQAAIAFEEEADIAVKAGYYYEFINEKDYGLATIIEINKDSGLDKKEIVREVKSSTFGELKEVDTLPYLNGVYDKPTTLLHNLTFKNLSARRASKKIKNDTISIQLTNGKKLLFVRNTN